MNDPLVSVVTCVYNAADYLGPAVESVLDHSYKNLEVLIVNDGSTDGCMETISDVVDPRIRIIHRENKGKPSALNAALARAKGEFIAVMDADYLAHLTWLADTP